MDLRRYKLVILTTIFSLILFSSAQAHFVWVYSHEGKINVVFGEWLEPDQAQFLGGLSGMKSFTNSNGDYKAIDFEKKVDGDQGWFEIPSSTVGDVVEVTCPYGVFGRGDKNMYLDYSAKYATMPAAAKKLGNGKSSPNLALDIIPAFKKGKLTAKAYFNGQPAPGVELSLESVKAETATLETNKDGVATFSPTTRYVLRAKKVVEEPGEVDGKAYTEKRYYCTLVLDVEGLNQESNNQTASAKTKTAASKKSEPSVTISRVKSKFADFPKGMTSFGATVLDDNIYVIGGKSGRAHSYAKSYQNRNVYRLNLSGSDKQWQVAGENLGLQGLAIVGHSGKLYRIGGLEARNKEGEDHDLNSISDFVAFDPENKTWTELPSLPEGRSSFDACISGNHVFVVGGWNMSGENETVWATDMLKFDLTKPNSNWERIEAPFETRALAVRCHQGKLVAIGGIEKAGGPTAAVHIYDLKSGKWSAGPAVPTTGGIKAFGCSAVTLGDHLLVSTYDGGIFSLSEDMNSWAKSFQLEDGRFFHQMLPVGANRFALVGGSHMEHGSHFEIELYEVTQQ